MKSKLKLLVVLLVPLFMLGCMTTNATGGREIDWLPSIIMSMLLIVGVVAGAIGLGNMLRS